jgi:hypothetical protein
LRCERPCNPSEHALLIGVLVLLLALLFAAAGRGQTPATPMPRGRYALYLFDGGRITAAAYLRDIREVSICTQMERTALETSPCRCVPSSRRVLMSGYEWDWRIVPPDSMNVVVPEWVTAAGYRGWLQIEFADADSAP